MKHTKNVVAHLEKCYSLAELTYQDRPCILVAAEKHAPCLLFSEDGTLLSTVWTEPGGVMSMVPVPGGNGAFLATHQFYSPNDAKEAKLVLATPCPDGTWQVRTMAKLPFVHRFGLLTRNGVTYLLACTLKGDHQYKDDWTTPGATYACVLPEDLSGIDEAHPLALQPVRTGLLKNHGFSLVECNGVECALVTCQQGVFLYTPPFTPSDPWEVSQLVDLPVSDAVMCDLDNDGESELACISPFHGDTLLILKKDEAGKYREVFQAPKPLEMLHAIWAGRIQDRNVLVVGHRKGERDTLIVSFVEGKYHMELLDHDIGAANVLHHTDLQGRDVIWAANRETDEIATYTF